MKRKIQFLVITGLLLVITIACQSEELFEKNTTSEIINKKISLEAAKSLFEAQETQKREEMKTNKSDYFLELTPDWNSFSHQGEDDSYYSKIEATLFGSKIKGEILFLGTNDSLKQYLFMTRIDSVDADDNDLILNARFYFFETNGKLLEAYKMEKGKIVKKFQTPKLSKTSKSTECSGYIAKVAFSEMDDWEIGCGKGGGGGGSGENDPDSIWGPGGFSFNHTSEIKGVEVYGIRKSNNTWLSHWVYINNYYNRIQNPRPSALSGGPRDKSDIYGGGGGIPPKTKSKADDKIEDSEIRDPKIRCIHDKLRKGNNDYVKQILDKFEGDGTEFDIVIKSEPRIRDSKGIERDSRGIAWRDGRTIHIRISESKAAGRSVLDVARTIFHEYIHADIHRKLNTKYDENTTEIKSFRETYNDYMKMLAEKNNIREVPKDRKQHEYMAKYYVSVLSEGLKKFHQDYFSDDIAKYEKHMDEKIPDKLYEALAWIGLKEHGVDAFNGLSDEEKNEIKLYEDRASMLSKNCN